MNPKFEFWLEELKKGKPGDALTEAINRLAQIRQQNGVLKAQETLLSNEVINFFIPNYIGRINYDIKQFHASPVLQELLLKQYADILAKVRDYLILIDSFGLPKNAPPNEAKRQASRGKTIPRTLIAETNRKWVQPELAALEQQLARIPNLNEYPYLTRQSYEQLRPEVQIIQAELAALPDSEQTSDYRGRPSRKIFMQELDKLKRAFFNIAGNSIYQDTRSSEDALMNAMLSSNIIYNTVQEHHSNLKQKIMPRLEQLALASSKFPDTQGYWNDLNRKVRAFFEFLDHSI